MSNEFITEKKNKKKKKHRSIVTATNFFFFFIKVALGSYVFGQLHFFWQTL